MHMVIDLLAAMILLLFLLGGWYKGFLLSLLSIVRVLLACSLSYMAGRYLGSWLGVALHRPRIVMVPAVGGLTFIIITLIFYVIMNRIVQRHRQRAEDGKTPVLFISRIGGGCINLAAGILSLIFLVWLSELLIAAMTGSDLPDTDRSRFVRFSRASIYRGITLVSSREGHELQTAAAARTISRPAEGIKRLEKVLAAPSFQALISDPVFAEDLLSGDPERIARNASMQRLFNDRATLIELREAGVLWDRETKEQLCRKLARIGSNRNVQVAIAELESKNLLRAEMIPYLIRDPDFDIIVGELLK